MRISGGEAKGTRLKVPAGARPASERVRQAVFSSVAGRLPGARILDLFCGSGAYGLEALSRGASVAVFVDRDPAALQAVRANAKAAGLDDRALYRKRDAARYTGEDGPFDLVFADPPYGQDLTARVLTAVHARLAPGAMVIVESRRSDDGAQAPSGYLLEADRRYGDTQVRMYLREDPGEAR